MFAFSYDPGEEEYFVHKASNAFSFAEIPSEFQCYFGKDRAKAKEQVRRLNKWLDRGNEVKTRVIETPDRFEAVADKKYGPAW